MYILKKPIQQTNKDGAAIQNVDHLADEKQLRINCWEICFFAIYRVD